jgi:hypothetical protein
VYVKAQITKFYENTKGWYYFECKPLEPCGFKHFNIYHDAIHAVGKKKEDFKVGDIVELEIIPRVYRVLPGGN